MHTSSLLFLGLPTAALAALGLSHATPSGNTAPAAPAGETATPAGLVFGDVDGDGKDDAFVVSAEGQARLLMNFGEGRFEDVTLAANLAELGGATCALFADLDGDERVDLFAGSSEHRVWRNLGNATFEPMASGIEHDLVDLAALAVDRDQDGRLDLQIHTEAGDLVYRNLGAGRFERLALPLGDLPQAPAHVGWMAPDSMDAADPLAAPEAGTPAERRLGRWVQGRAAGGLASTATSAASGTSSLGAPLPFLASCQPGVRDANGGACIGASSVPTLGKLFPLSQELFVDSTTDNVGMGTTSPDENLQIGEYFVTSEDNFIELRTTGGGPNFDSGMKMRASNPFFGFDIVHDDTLKGLDIRRWDNDFAAFGASALFVNRTNGKIGIGTTTPTALALATVGRFNTPLGISIETLGAILVDHDLQAFGGPALALGPNRAAVAGQPITSLTFRGDGIMHAGFTYTPNAVSRIDMNFGASFEQSVNPALFSFLSSGRLGIGTTAPAFNLEVNGTAGKPGGGSWSVSSDRRLKKNVADLEGALDTLLALRGVSFEYIDPAAAHELPGTRVGFIAQEVEEVLPDWVEEVDGYKRLTIRGFEALAVEAFREQEEKIETQRDEIASLRSRVAQLESLQSEIETLKTSLAALAAR